MATNKVVYNGKILIDLTGDTVTASTLVEGITAHNKAGNVVTGTIINTGKGKYVWGKYRAVPAITKTSTKSSKVPNDFTNSTTYNSYSITDDGYFKLGSIGMDTYLLPNGATNGKTKKIAYKQYGSYNNYYYIWTLGDEKTEKGTLLGYVSSDDSSAYPDDGIQDNYYYVKLSASSYSSGGSTDTNTSKSNNNCEAYLVDVTNPTVSFKTTSGTIKAYGYATAKNSSSWGGSTTTMYAFNGTNYYKSVSYGTPSATSMTLSVSNGKLTGLPDLTSGTLLVTKGI